MTTYDNLWQRMTAFDNLWQLMTAYDSLWQLWTTFDIVWHHLTTFDNLWQLMTTYDKFWQLLTLVRCMLCKLSSSWDLVVGLVLFKKVVSLCESKWFPLSVLPVQCRTASLQTFVEKSALAILTTHGVEEDKWELYIGLPGVHFSIFRRKYEECLIGMILSVSCFE